MSKNRFVAVVVAVIGAGVVAALYRFNRSAVSYNQYIVGNLIGLFWVPILSILFIFREEPARFGLTLGGSRRLWFLTALLFAGLVVVMVPASRWQVFQDYYPIFRRFHPEFGGVFASYPRNSPWTVAPWLMVFAEVSYGMYLFCWEFFFRGYLLLGLSRAVGWWAVPLQAAAFGLLHFGKPVPEMIASFGAGIVLGWIALRARSFIPCFALHWAASLVFDALVVSQAIRGG
ncbi:MAG: CPBP family intramembrane metalloprotease [Armatimonadota bacterium]|nr:CPBP family intramembrane metalloprotease [Armatimonadota bacterium]